MPAPAFQSWKHFAVVTLETNNGRFQETDERRGLKVFLSFVIRLSSLPGDMGYGTIKTEVFGMSWERDRFRASTGAAAITDRISQ